MNRSRRSFYIALTSILYSLTNGLLVLIANRRIIEIYGSDFNGLSSTANQFIAILYLLEGGFTIAINVALFDPINQKNVDSINSILSAASEIFKKIGIITLVIGTSIGLVYAIFVNSSLPYLTIAATFMMLVISTSFNFYFSIQYSILFQSEQKEYVLNVIKILCAFFTQGLIILCTYVCSGMLVIRVIVMLGSILNSLLVVLMCRHDHPELRFDRTPDYSSIKGSKDILVQKMTNMVYLSAPILVISATAGTMMASVYSVYYSVISMIKSMFSSIVGAPRIGLGQVIAEKDDVRSYSIFTEYESIVFIGASVVISVTSVLIIPFVILYTGNVSDIEYRNELMALILVATTFFEVIHIPSGNLITMSGHFKAARNIQVIAFLVLCVSIIVGFMAFNIYGVICAVLFTAISLCFMEIGYVHLKVFPNTLKSLLKRLITNASIMLILILVEVMSIKNIMSYLTWIHYGFLLLIFNTITTIFVNYIFNRSDLIKIIKRVLSLIIITKGENGNV